ncbi:16S rRNA (cytosine(1402)-N(4))-methyltransferase RsmH [Nesterenkonia sp. F]|uniref:16S rRNA (cytosine(1402)-N(4))-methyltransferase RsmH n=1 Tax=Nesterenkonia sp. F TaxID=795955 RepID=UPI000255CEC6|nr:16S rRNA (cytosine(1402)-N(4))-methyltransferase RsmH [Nesterenkonia sp. F]
MSERAASDRHVPVMRDRCLELLRPGLDAARAAGETPVVVDATLGMGGHAEALLAVEPDVVVLGLDRDPQALQLAGERLSTYGDRLRGVRTVYDRVDEVAAEHLPAGRGLAGVLFDLGVSSLQLDEAERGFAYSYDAPLDMRMDGGEDSEDETAAELLTRVSEAELRTILREWGEEKFAGRIARSIVARRADRPFATTADLAAVVDSAVPAAAKRTGGHPAKRTFQALRIAVNRELEVLADAVPRAMDALAPGGRLVVLSYHSLEDRIVKRAIAGRTTSSAPVGLPVELEEHKPTFRAVTRGAETPDDAERAANPRAASAKLRSAEKIRAVRSTT